MALPIPASPHRRAFRKIVDTWQADDDLKKVVKTWFVWDGSVADRVPFGLSLCPSIAAMPGRGPDSFLGPSGFRGPLYVDLVVTLAGTNVDDLLDLYHAIQRATYPADDAARVVIRSALLAIGADTGEVEFTQPKVTPSADDSGPYIQGQGQARLTLRTIDP